MAHRGRLAVLANVIGKGVAQIFSEFEGDIDSDLAEGTGDVKYHLGASSVRQMSGGQEITVSVAANPSHLEAVNPVVEGIVRPKQDRMGDAKRERVIPLLIHGDAAMSGQGIVAETLNFSQVNGYTTGGTIHLVINNQIGFTTNPREARSSTYCTDVALRDSGADIPREWRRSGSVRAAMELAFDYRQRFHKDVVLDMVCYRKHGHNEGDDPSYTQPLIYRKMQNHKPVAALYAERLIHDGVVTAQEVAAWQEAQKKQLYEIYDHTQKVQGRVRAAGDESHRGRVPAGDLPPTAADRAVLDRIIDGITTFPAGFPSASEADAG